MLCFAPVGITLYAAMTLWLFYWTGQYKQKNDCLQMKPFSFMDGIHEALAKHVMCTSNPNMNDGLYVTKSVFWSI
jgi:hypothetical protein